jgi:hypothetical protein
MPIYLWNILLGSLLISAIAVLLLEIRTRK